MELETILIILGVLIAIPIGFVVFILLGPLIALITLFFNPIMAIGMGIVWFMFIVFFSSFR